MRARHFLALAAFLLLAPMAGQAQAPWPTRPVRMLVPFAPGGVTDGIARLSADWLSRAWGQPVIVENRSGANGAIAAEFVTRAAPDGYTLLMASASQMVALPALTRLSFDPTRDFAPITIVAGNPMLVAVHTGLGVQSLEEFVEAVRRRPGQLSYSSGGIGTTAHLAMALFLAQQGLEMQHIPYRGGAPATQALLSGEVPAQFAHPADTIPHQDGGRIRLLAVAAATRLPSLPQVPTIEEAGFPAFHAGTWNGLVGPARLPSAIITHLNTEMAQACHDAGFRAALERLGTLPDCGTPEHFRETVRHDSALWREAVRVSGASQE